MVPLPTLGADNFIAQSGEQLVLDQGSTLDEKTCSCSTGVGLCHIIYRFSGSTCEKSNRVGETECTGTCAFKSSPSGGSRGVRQR